MVPGAGAGVLRNSHLRSTPWGGRSRPIDPCGKARKITKETLRSENRVQDAADRPGRRGRVSGLRQDLHEQRLEILRRRALGHSAQLQPARSGHLQTRLARQMDPDPDEDPNEIKVDENTSRHADGDR